MNYLKNINNNLRKEKKNINNSIDGLIYPDINKNEKFEKQYESNNSLNIEQSGIIFLNNFDEVVNNKNNYKTIEMIKIVNNVSKNKIRVLLSSVCMINSNE